MLTQKNIEEGKLIIDSLNKPKIRSKSVVCDSQNHEWIDVGQPGFVHCQKCGVSMQKYGDIRTFEDQGRIAFKNKSVYVRRYHFDN